MGGSQQSVSHHTSDTEENNGIKYQTNKSSVIKNARKRRLSKVEEEMKQGPGGGVGTASATKRPKDRDVQSEINEKLNES